jgi:hypothetical protein
VVLGGSASSLGVTINNTRALELPGVCSVKTPPASQCKCELINIQPVTLPLLSSPQHLPFSMLNDLFRFECWDRVCDLIFKTCSWSPSLCLSCMFSWRGRVGDQCGHMYALYVFFAK